MPDARPTTILIVDDDQGLLTLIKRALKREGWEVATAHSEATAIEWFSENSADLMLLDLKLQDTEGKALVERLESSGKSTPFIAITGQGDERVAVDLMKRGALDYLVKDVQFLEILPTVVRRALGHIEQEKRLLRIERAQRLQLDAALVLAQARSLSDAITRTLEVICNSLEFPLGELWNVGGSNENLRQSWFWCADPQKFSNWITLSATLQFKPGEGLAGRVWESRQPEFLADLGTHGSSPRSGLVSELGVRSGFGFPILLHNEVAAVMCFFGPARNPPNNDLLSSFTSVGGQIGQLIERRQMERELLEISDREQFRIGRDLHDGLGQHLTALEFFSVNLAQDLHQKAPDLVPSINRMGEQLREAIRQTRAMASGLAPVSLHQKDGLPVALQKLADGTATMARVKCTFESEARIKITAQSDATNLYRIAQEAVNNALKHGQASTIEISLRIRNGHLELGIQDNGRGFVANERAESGMGLRIMKYRADLIGGLLTILSVPGNGTHVTCRIPYRPAGGV